MDRNLLLLEYLVFIQNLGISTILVTMLGDNIAEQIKDLESRDIQGPKVLLNNLNFIIFISLLIPLLELRGKHYPYSKIVVDII